MIYVGVVIPAYNERDSIAHVVNTIQQLNQTQDKAIYTPIVVNDCSTDNTAQIINKLACVALHLPVNLGIGGAVQTGYKYAYQKQMDFAVQVDGDGQHPAEALPIMLKKMQDESIDVLIGSRFIEKQGFQSSYMRRLGIVYFKWLNKLLTGQTITDNTSGLRMLNRKAIEIVTKYYPDEYPEPESFILFKHNNCTIAEIAVQMLERQGGVSSISASKSIYYMAKVSLAIIFTHFRLKYI